MRKQISAKYLLLISSVISNQILNACLEELRVKKLNSFYTPAPVEKLQPSSVIHLHDDNDHIHGYIRLEEEC